MDKPKCTPEDWEMQAAKNIIDSINRGLQLGSKREHYQYIGDGAVLKVADVIKHHNPMEGIGRPEKVKELIEAARDAVNLMSKETISRYLEGLEKALAALEMEEKDGHS